MEVVAEYNRHIYVENVDVSSSHLGPVLAVPLPLAQLAAWHLLLPSLLSLAEVERHIVDYMYRSCRIDM